MPETPEMSDRLERLGDIGARLVRLGNVADADVVFDAIADLRQAAERLSVPQDAPTPTEEAATSGGVGFTPGPWSFSETPIERDPRVWVYAPIGPNRPRLACVEALWPRDGAEAVKTNLANARLIAAAPDLLEALQGAKRALNAQAQMVVADAQGHDRTCDRLDREISTWREQAEAAIAKALGAKS